MLESSLCENGPVPTYPITLYTGPVSNVGENPKSMKHTDLRYLYDHVQGGKWEKQIAAVRALAAHKNEKGPDGKPTEKARTYKAAKDLLAFSIVSGHYTPGHRHSPEPQRPNLLKTNHANQFPQCEAGGAYPPIPSGVRFVELDDLDAAALDAAKACIIEHPLGHRLLAIAGWTWVACFRPGGPEAGHRRSRPRRLRGRRRRARYCRHRRRVSQKSG